jgi:hypothetical protein
MVCPAFHEYQDFMETEILSSTPIFENLHHDDLAANQESKYQNWDLLNASFFTIPPLANNVFQQASHDSFPSSSSDPRSTNLRC